MRNEFAPFILLFVGSTLFAADPTPQPLTVCCNEQLDYAPEILKEFTQQTGIEVRLLQESPTEKKIGLIDQFLADMPPADCDVIWDHDMLGMMELAEKGVLLPYRSPNLDRINDQYRDAHGKWIGFSGRMRIWLVNETKMPARHDAILSRFLGNDLTKFATATPLHGSPLTHMSILWQHNGDAVVKEWHQTLRKKGMKTAADENAVRNLITSGECDFGWTDSDQYFRAKADGFPVDMIPVRVESETICLPNTVAILKGTKHLAAAQKLVDYLTSEQTEMKLAASISHLIPLGDVDEQKLPEEVRKLRGWSAEAMDIRRCHDAREFCLDWLELLPPAR
ncbi:ABC transporter substrate-binding protein [Planctomicrobium sp. SH661]|uniref:ABC transporter substrate-binding protein n=1 Tax=Planctomicrobium sp. SH661 TaxID=3448124 RepID=UPI003F5B46B1